MPEDDPKPKQQLRPPNLKESLCHQLRFNPGQGVQNDYFNSKDYLDGLNGLHGYNQTNELNYTQDLALNTFQVEQENDEGFRTTVSDYDDVKYEVSRVGPKPTPDNPSPENTDLALRLRLEPQQIEHMSDDLYKRYNDTMNDLSMHDSLRYNMPHIEHHSPYAPGGPLEHSDNAPERLKIEQDSMMQSYGRYKVEYEKAGMRPKFVVGDRELSNNDYESWRQSQEAGDTLYHFRGGDHSALTAGQYISPSLRDTRQDDPEIEQEGNIGHRPDRSPTRIPKPTDKPDPFS